MSYASSWDFTLANYDAVWAFMVQLGLLLLFLMMGNILRRTVPLFRKCLIPSALLGGALLLAVDLIVKQFGFTLRLEDGSKLCCLGDEPYNPICAEHVQGAKWVLCEAFCLYGDRERFKPYEKHHSTVKDACELAQELNIPHLVLWHTEDRRIGERKKLYTEEGKQYYTGNLFVPDDLDVIEL